MGGRSTGDSVTLAAYDPAAASYAAEWEDEQEAPGDLYELLSQFFTPGSVIEVGCGSGRDAAWLTSQGYAVTAFDGSAALVGQARERHPGLAFAVATLPGLTEIGRRQAANVLCETVLMHLPADEIAAPPLIRGVLGGAVVLYDGEQRSTSSGKTVHRIIVRRPR